MDLRANAIITAIDRFSAPVQRMSGALNSLTRGSAAAARASRRAAHTLAGPGSLGAMLGSGIFLSRQLDFESKLNRTQALLNETNVNAFKPLREEITRLAKAYPAMRGEIAQGASELAMAGMPLEAIKAVMEDTVRGAMASGESIKTVGEGVTDVIYSMGLPFSNATEQAASFAKVNDILAAAATSANDTYTGFLTSLGRAGPVARMAGVDLTSLAAAHGVLANAGIKSERAGIALRSMMVRALAPTKKAREMMRSIGVDWTKWTTQTGAKLSKDGLFGMLEEGGVDTSGLGNVSKQIEAMLSDPVLTKNLGVLGDKVTSIIADSLNIAPDQLDDRTKLSDTVRDYLSSTAAALNFPALFKELADKNATLPLLKELLSLRHVEKAGALVDAFQRGLFDQMLAAIESKAPNATQRMADIMMQGFVGAYYRMVSAFDAFGDTLARTGVMDTMTNVFTMITDGINKLADINPKILEWGTYAMLISGGLSVISLAFSGIAGPISLLGGALAASPIAATIAAIAASITLLAAANEKFDPEKGVIGWVKDMFSQNAESWWDSVKRWNAKADEIPTIYELLLGKDAKNIWGQPVREQRAPISYWLDHTPEKLPPLARTTDELIRSLVPSAGPQQVDVTGKVQADVQGKVSGKMDVDVHITGVGDVSGFVKDKRGGDISGDLKTGKSMPDTGGP